MKKYLMYALLAFIAFYLLKSPAGAADTVHRGMAAVSAAGDSLSHFVNAL